MKNLLFILFFLPVMAFSQDTVRISGLPPLRGNPATWAIPGIIPSGSSSSNWSNRLFFAADFLNRSYHTGQQAKATVTGLQTTLDSIVASFGGYATTSALSSGLAGKWNTPTTSTPLFTLNGSAVNYGSTVTASGGGGSTLDTTSTAFKKSIAQISRDSALSQTIPFAATDFQNIGGTYYLKGSYYSPTGTNGNGNIVVSFQTGSRNRKGVVIVTFSTSVTLSEGQDLAVISFGGETYSNGISVTVSADSGSPIAKTKSRSSGGFSLTPSGNSITFSAGTYYYPYQVEAL